MRLHFVNHASILLEHGGHAPDQRPVAVRHGVQRRLGPRLQVGARRARARRQVDYIWYSHEHPDHFSPRVLQDVPKERRSARHRPVPRDPRREGAGLLQEARLRDPRAARRRAGRAGRRPAGHLSARCRCSTRGSCVEAGGQRVLNLNDAVLQTPSELAPAARAGRRRSTPCSPSSATRPGAATAATPSCVARTRARSSTSCARRCAGSRRAATVPFASLSLLLARGERVHRATRSTTPGRCSTPIAAARLDARCCCTPAMPGRSGAPHDNASAVARYRADYAALAEPPAAPLRAGSRSRRSRRPRAATSSGSARANTRLAARPAAREPDPAHPAAARRPALGPGHRRAVLVRARARADRRARPCLRPAHGVGQPGLRVQAGLGHRHAHRERALPGRSRGPEAPGPDLRGRHAEQHRHPARPGVPGRFRVDRLPAAGACAGSSPACAARARCQQQG